MDISVIISTYNSPEWLAKVIVGYECQKDNDFEIVIADDGSNRETRKLISEMRHLTGLDIKHVWQEDRGFRKCRILNKAILASDGDYLIMTDGDCIPRTDFVAVHRENAEQGCFLSGGYFKLPMSISQRISMLDIASGRPFDSEWLESQGYESNFKAIKLKVNHWQARICNRLTPTRRTWNGHNASGWKADALRVNGFDERMQYGGEDCEFGERLKNIGIKAKQIRYSAICVHLDHERGYVTEDMRRKNRAIRQHTKRQHIMETPFGIRQQSY